MRFAPALALFLTAAALAPAAASGADASSRQDQQWQLAGGPAVKLVVRRDGWYHASRQKLRAAGLPSSAPAKTLRLFTDGRQVPIRVQNGSIEFFGQARTSPVTDARTYWLVWGGQAGKRLAPPRLARAGAHPARSFTSKVESRPRDVYLAWLKGGPTDNFFGPLIRPGTPATEKISVPMPAPGGRPSLDVGVQGLSLTTHRVTVAVNGTTVGSVSFQNQKAAHFRALLPARLVKAGANVVTVASGANDLDFAFLWQVKVTYARRLTAVGNQLDFQLGRGRGAQVGGFTTRNIRLVDVTYPYRPRLAPAAIRRTGSRYTLLVPAAPRGRRLLAVGGSGILTPVSISPEHPSQWHAAGQGADMLIISYGAFIGSLAPLVDLHRSEGLSVKVVDVQDLYDEFTYGVPEASAIHTFLARAYADWKPRPRYVLLVGDASYDPHDYLGAGQSDFVPSASVQTSDSIVPSDNALADFNDDGVPDIAVGRLPVDTPAETATVVQKIVSYETQPPASGRSALFVADHDPRLDLEGAADSLATLLPGSMPVERVYRRDSADVGSFRTTLRTALDSGPEIVDYVGHGGPEVWSESYIDYKQAAQLQNGGRLSLYVMTSCLNAWFLEPKSESLAEALLKAPNGGAIATVSSSGTETLEEGSKINREFLRALFAGDSPTIGAAFQAATRTAGGGQLTRMSLLFGDPASRLR